MFALVPSERASTRSSVERYLGPGEHVLYATRRHSAVLDPAVVVWLGGVVLALVLSLAAPGHPGWHLGQVGSAVFVAGSAILGWRAWQWSAARYVVTNERVLFIQGIVARQVNGVPLRGVLDTTYRRTLGGRLRGYGALELNITGHPGLRTLVPLRHPDAFYQLILSLMHPADPAAPPRAPAWAAAEPDPSAQQQVTRTFPQNARSPRVLRKSTETV